uniref:Uncharacterized protein n=1 Tax=Ascaris lumbricoides TaxID=6252 RepID=A0A9J2Q1R7_ASCLU
MSICSNHYMQNSTTHYINLSFRVSFDEHQVKTFVYEKETNDLSSEFTRVKQPFTDIHSYTFLRHNCGRGNDYEMTSVVNDSSCHP